MSRLAPGNALLLGAAVFVPATVVGLGNPPEPPRAGPVAPLSATSIPLPKIQVNVIGLKVVAR